MKRELTETARLAADGGMALLIASIIWTAKQFGADMDPLAAGGFALVISRAWSRFERWMER